MQLGPYALIQLVKVATFFSLEDTKRLKPAML